MNEVISYTEAQRAADAVYNRGGVLTLPAGWQLDTTFAANGQRTGASGVYVYALKPAGSDDGRRILAFRGTELPNARDLYADATNIGKTQFLNAQSDINRWLAQELVAGRWVELVGHSLGGALVQWAINDTNKAQILNITPNPDDPNPKPLASQFVNQLHFIHHLQRAWGKKRGQPVLFSLSDARLRSRTDYVLMSPQFLTPHSLRTRYIREANLAGIVSLPYNPPVCHTSSPRA